jgi:hypothetical protein
MITCHKCGTRPAMAEPLTIGSGLWLCFDCTIERINFLIHKGEDLQHKEDVQGGAAITTSRDFKDKGGKLS